MIVLVAEERGHLVEVLGEGLLLLIELLSESLNISLHLHDRLPVFLLGVGGVVILLAVFQVLLILHISILRYRSSGFRLKELVYCKMAGCGLLLHYFLLLRRNWRVVNRLLADVLYGRRAIGTNYGIISKAHLLLGFELSLHANHLISSVMVYLRVEWIGSEVKLLVEPLPSVVVSDEPFDYLRNEIFPIDHLLPIACVLGHDFIDRWLNLLDYGFGWLI